jgi:hypothetical protein
VGSKVNSFISLKLERKTHIGGAIEIIVIIKQITKMV